MLRSEKTRERVAELHKAGKSDAEIADALGLKKGTVKVYRVQAGFLRRPSPKQRSPEEKAAMQRMIYEDGATLKEVGEAFGGLSPQRVSQLVGKLNRSTTWRIEIPQSKRREVLRLARQGLSRPEIEQITGVKMASISRIAHQAGFKFKTGYSRRRQLILDDAIRWYRTYGWWPKPADWKFSLAKKYPDRLERFKSFDHPSYETVRDHFPSFGAMIKAAKRRERYLRLEKNR